MKTLLGCGLFIAGSIAGFISACLLLSNAKYENESLDYEIGYEEGYKDGCKDTERDSLPERVQPEVLPFT